MAPKLTSCDVFGKLVKYWLSTEGGFGGSENVNPVVFAGKWLWAAFGPSVCGSNWWQHDPLLGGSGAL